MLHAHEALRTQSRSTRMPSSHHVRRVYVQCVVGLVQDDNLNDEQQLYARFEALLTEHDFNFKRGVYLREPALAGGNPAKPSSLLDSECYLGCFSAVHIQTKLQQTAVQQFKQFIAQCDSVPDLTFVSIAATGDKVVGTVFTTDQRGAYVDIGAKGQAFVPMEELSLSKVDRVRRCRKNVSGCFDSQSVDLSTVCVKNGHAKSPRNLHTLSDAIYPRKRRSTLTGHD